MQYARPPIGGKQYVLDTSNQPKSIGETNYERYAYRACEPGPVISAKTGKLYTPKLAQIGMQKPPRAAKQKSTSYSQPFQTNQNYQQQQSDIF